MQTSLTKVIRDTPEGNEADSILRSCVHCGFCTATCPTYQLLGDELDGPRGRIYLIKQVLEGNEVTRKTQQHLDRCLTCRACETTCPSGVRYARLLDIGREVVDKQVGRSLGDRLLRKILRLILPFQSRVKTLLTIGKLLRPLLPGKIKKKIPAQQTTNTRPVTRHPRSMLVLEGCVQSVATPNTNAAACRLLSQLGINLLSAAEAGCCGAVSYHMNAHKEGLDFMRRNIDAWWPYIKADSESPCEAIVISASGCGAMVKEYGDVLKDDPDYAEKAQRITELCKDLTEILLEEDLSSLNISGNRKKIAIQTPCTLQHAQQLNGVIDTILQQLGFELTAVADPHLCCGSAGTYSILQKELSQQLLEKKLETLGSGEPELIVTANTGCQLHLESESKIPVKHWIELLDEATQKKV